MQNINRDSSGDIFFAAYTGPSMNPTLRESEILEIMPYNKRPLHVGDVVFFLSPVYGLPIVHRIVRVNSAGIHTLGDNNTNVDTLILQPESIKGQVIAAWRGQKRRNISGGLQGRLISSWLRCMLVLDRRASPLLHPFYQYISHWGLLAWVLPASFRPRIVVFRLRGRDQFQLLIGNSIIGRYDDQKNKWFIQRPFQMFVDRRLLSGLQDKNLLNRKVPTRWKKNINHMLTHEVSYYINLADGIHWEIIALDKEAASIVSQLGYSMQLSVAEGAIKSSHPGNLRRLFVQAGAHITVANCYVPLASKKDGTVVCVLSPNDYWGGPFVNLVRLSLIFAREAQARGGFLIHGALAEKDGIGVILAAPGGTGKTTASNRLQAPWRSLCDDTTLVVRDPQGRYWGHPWPSWSRFLDNGPGGTWDVKNAVVIRGIFFLDQADKDHVERVGPGHAVSMLIEYVKQASRLMTPGLGKEKLHTLHLEIFNNLFTLVGVIPAYVLQISLTGTFWQEIEQALQESEGHLNNMRKKL